MPINYDHYAVAKGLAQKLELAGHNDEAQKIRDVMADGSTGTEILMGLRWQLQQLKQNEPPLSKQITDQLEELLSEIHKSLN